MDSRIKSVAASNLKPTESFQFEPMFMTTLKRRRGAEQPELSIVSSGATGPREPPT